MFKRLLAKGNALLQWLLISLLKAYQLLLSPLLGNRCRFYPNCSLYAQEAIQYYGPVRGSWLVLKRLLRCHPFCAGGYDPVLKKEQAATTEP